MNATQDVRNHDALENSARVGLVGYGVVHVLIAWITVQLAWGGSSEEASESGALQELAEKPLGGTLLWIVAAGLAALTLWQLATAIWGFRTEDGAERARHCVAAVGRGVVYAVLAFSAARTATGSGGGGDSSQEGMTARLMGAPAGPWLVGAVGLGIAAVGVYLVWRGISQGFTVDLRTDALAGRTEKPVMVTGTVGHVAKGAAIAVVGVLFLWAAATYDPEKAGGLDDALSTLRDQPYGPYLLTAIALGLLAFGLYCFAWARYVRQR
jgi:hypothetical protein